MLPAPVEHVDREGGLEALDLEAQLEGLDEQDQALTVPHDEAGVVQLVDDLLPVEVGVELVENLDEDFQLPGLGLVRILVLFRPQRRPGGVEVLQRGLVQTRVGANLTKKPNEF